MKILAISICLLPLIGCAIGIGAVFSSLIYGVSRNPASYDTTFSLALMGFALIELLVFIALGVIVFVFIAF